MEATTAATRSPAGRTGATRDRLLAIIGAIAGALAVSGSLLTWVTVQKHRRSIAVRGTSFGAGKLVLLAGIVIVVAAVLWIVTSAPRLRAASAVIALAAGAAIAISIVAGLASGAFSDVPGAPKHDHPHQNNGSTPGPSSTATAIGAAYVLHPAGGRPDAVDRSGGVTFRAMAGGQGKRRNGSTLGPGVFIALAGGIVAMFVGIWALLSGRSEGVDAAPTGPTTPIPTSPTTPIPTSPTDPTNPTDPADPVDDAAGA